MLLSGQQLTAQQGIAAYLDERGRFMVWEDGQEFVAEHQGVTQWELSPNYVAYLDQAGELHIFQDGKSIPMEVVRPAELNATQHFLIYRTRDQVSLIENAKKKHFGFLRDTLIAIGDSIAGYMDYNGHMFVYHNGQTKRLDLTAEFGPTAGDNVLCWLDNNRRMQAYWNGQSGIISDLPPNHVAFKPGRFPYLYYAVAVGSNTIAWENQFNRVEIFHRGQMYEPEGGFLPAELGAGDDIVVWISQDREELYLFWMGTTRRILAETPSLLDVKDRLVWFADVNGYFKAFYDGTLHTLESYTPDRIEAQGNVLAYTDINGRLKALYKGEPINVSDNIVREFGVNGDLIWWSDRPFKYHFFTQ